MFRIVCLCDDKRLASILRGLAGQIRGAPEVTPVTNIEDDDAEHPEGAPRAATNGKVHEMFTMYLRKSRPTEITAQRVKEFLGRVGRSQASTSYVLTKAKEDGLIKKKPGTYGAGTIWLVVPRKAKEKSAEK